MDWVPLRAGRIKCDRDRIVAAILATTLLTGGAAQATEIDLFFPVQVHGKLAVEMQRPVEQFDKDHAGIHVTAVYTPYRTAFLPRNVFNAVPTGSASLIVPQGNSPERGAAAWTLINGLTSPEIAGGWSRFTGYVAPRIAAYDLPEMKSFMAEHPDAKVALDQLAYARGWFAIYNTVGVRKVLEDGVQAVLSGKATPESAMEAAQRQADALMKPYVEQTALKLPE
jgi:ABC-type glycerol-3-phosphate transport system substrate-binding protein